MTRKEDVAMLQREWSDRSKAAGVTEFVRAKMRELEVDFGIKVFFAVEHSSHVWGTSHEDSDWDVKMVYCYNLNRYFSPEELHSSIKRVYGPRESTQIKGVGKSSSKSQNSVTDLDVEISGWDIVQFTKLVKSGDATVMNMLVCPLVYIGTEATMKEVALAGCHFCPPSKLAKHNVTMAKSLFCMLKENKGKYGNLSPGTKQTKGFGYILRNLLSAHVLLSAASIAAAPLHWKDLCDQLDALTSKALSPGADVGDLELFALDVDHFRSFFSRFGKGSLESPDLVMDAEELAAAMQLAQHALEGAERRLKRRPDASPHAKRSPPGPGALDAEWERRLAAWAVAVVRAPAESSGAKQLPAGAGQLSAEQHAPHAARQQRLPSSSALAAGREATWLLGGVLLGAAVAVLGGALARRGLR